MYNSSYTLLSIWAALSILYRLFVLILAAVSIYSFVSAAIVLKRVRVLTSPPKGQAPIQQHIAALYYRCRNLRQVLTATFCLFGLLFFIGLQDAFHTLGDGHGVPVFEILSSFKFHFFCAANVFFVFLVLHLVQWVTSTRVRACALRLDV